MNHPREDAARGWEQAALSPQPTKLAFRPQTVASLIACYPELRPPVIEGLLREGEVINIVAPPKVGKTWLVHSLALAVAAGTPWLGMPTRGGRVLIIDGELHGETLSHRLAAALDAAGASGAVARENLEAWSVRGQRLAIGDIEGLLAEVPFGKYRLVILDALYRFLPPDGEENSNETMTQVYNAVDALAAKLGSAIVLVHHSTKGAQAGKAVTDIGAGGGAQSRAADTHLVLRQHEEEGALVVEAAVRSWERLPPFVIRWADPGWVLAQDLDPASVRQPPSRRRAQPKAASVTPEKPGRIWTVEEFAAELVGPTPRIKDDVIAAARERGLSKSQAESYLNRAEEAKLVRRVQAGPSGKHRFTTAPEPQVCLPGGGEGAGAPPPPEPHARGGVGGCARPPSPPPRTKRKKAVA